MLFGIINTIAYGFFAVGWGLLVWPFVTILNIITELFGSISFDLLKNIFFGGSKEFSISQIPIVFWIITAIAVSLIIFLILQRLVRNFFLAGKQNYDSSLKTLLQKQLLLLFFQFYSLFFCFLD
ncbi:Mbov_0396 family ICE element transmembrane protein [Mesomycoplasma ovipneumoniae]|uniref:Mbov_0396 family ICE element transmembrane protein n=1 Tax=Mesomycoplasma ovipneumoniae TaxID=29562 RepID=UPI00311B3556